MRPRPNDILAGKYRVERILGAGGMGIVLEATHLQVDERVAIKMLLPELVGQREVVSRFLREAKAQMRIRSEHVVRVLDVGMLDDGGPYMAMELLEGCSLTQLLSERGPMRLGGVADCLLQACEALAEVHVKGIVHRDLKPSNIFLTRGADGTFSAKVLDFGISKMVGVEEAEPITQPFDIMGSPLYMAPEQLGTGPAVDARADIWALGVIFYELLTGRPPFDGATFVELCARVLQLPAPRVTELRPDVPDAIDAIVSRCLEKDPAARFANVAELALALAVFSSSAGRASAERIVRVLRFHGASVTEPTLDEGDTQPLSRDARDAAGALLSQRRTAPMRIKSLRPPPPPESAGDGSVAWQTGGSLRPPPSMPPPRSLRAPFVTALAVFAVAAGVTALFLRDQGPPARAAATHVEAPPPAPAPLLPTDDAVDPIAPDAGAAVAAPER